MKTWKPRGGIIVSEIDEYIVSFFFDDKVLKLSLLNEHLLVLLSFSKLKISMKLEKIRIFLSQFDLGKPWPN